MLYCTSLRSCPLIFIEHKSDGSSTWNFFICTKENNNSSVQVSDNLLKPQLAVTTYYKLLSIPACTMCKT